MANRVKDLRLVKDGNTYRILMTARLTNPYDSKDHKTIKDHAISSMDFAAEGEPTYPNGKLPEDWVKNDMETVLRVIWDVLSIERQGY